jgi:hypothetical protein
MVLPDKLLIEKFLPCIVAQGLKRCLKILSLFAGGYTFLEFAKSRPGRAIVLFLLGDKHPQVMEIAG